MSWFGIVLLFRRSSVSVRGYLLALGVALLIAAPLYITWAVWQLPFTPRLADVGSHQLDWAAILSLRDGGGALHDYLEQNLLPPLLHLIQRADTSRLHYGGDTPLILGYLLPVFFLGIFHTLWRWRTIAVLPLLWLALALLGNSLLNPVQNTWSARYLVLLPALALFIAVGFRYTLDLVLPSVSHRGSHPHTWRSRALALGRRGSWALMFGLAFLQPVYYFAHHLPYYNRQIRGESLDYIDLIYRVRGLPPDVTVIAVTGDVVDQTADDDLRLFWRFETWVTLITPPDFTADYLNSLPPGRYAFFMDSRIERATRLLRSLFPNLSGPHRSPYNVPLEHQFDLYVTEMMPVWPVDRLGRTAVRRAAITTSAIAATNRMCILTPSPGSAAFSAASWRTGCASALPASAPTCRGAVPSRRCPASACRRRTGCG